MIKLSVVIICYNQEKYIAQAIQSALNQTEKSNIHEILVIDDGSVDGSQRVISEILADADVPCRSIHQENAGAAAARNTGILNITGTHIAFLDGDDLWEPTKLRFQLDYLKDHTDTGLFFSDFIEFDEEAGVEYEVLVRDYQSDMPDALQRLFVEGGPILPTTAIIRRDAFDDVGLFDTSMKTNEDPEMWLRIAAAWPLQKIPGVAARKRVVANSLGSFKEENAKYYRIITERMIEGHPELGAFRNQREQRLVNFLSSALIRDGRRWEALRLLFSALFTLNIGKKGLIYLAICLTPVSSHKITQLARMTGNRSIARSSKATLAGQE